MDELDELWQRMDAAEKEGPATNQVRRVELIQEMNRLHNAARGFSRLRQIDSALSLYHKAYQAAVKAGDEENQARFKLEEGVCLGHLRRLREALACLVELEKMAANPKSRWKGLIYQISIATYIPISLHNIQLLMQRCSDEMKRRNLQSSRSMLLLEEAVLASLRHDVSTALARAQEAMHTYAEGASPNYNIISYYNYLIMFYLDAGDRISAERWLERYEGVRTWFEVDKELDILLIRQRIARLDGNYSVAWDYAQRFLQKARETENSPYVGLTNLAEMGIACGRLIEVRLALWELLSKYRNIEEGHKQYELRRLGGDYHWAMAQRAEPYTRENLRHTAIARRYYCYALKVGRFIDERLCCDWHEEEIQERLQSLNR